jgi:hypothetical protein
MKEAEDCSYCLDCWLRANPDTEHDTPAKRIGLDNLQLLEAQAQRLWEP